MIPRSLEDITPDYLTHLLRPRFPGANVTGVELQGEIHGTATKALLVLDGDGAFPRRMWLKSGWEPHSAVVAKVGIYAREPRVYCDLLPALGIEAPRCFGGEWDEASLEGIVLLEDLGETAAIIHSPLSQIGVDEAERMVTMLGTMHGRSARPEMADARAWLRPLFHDTKEPESYLNYVSRPETLEMYLAMPRGDALPAAVRDPLRIANAFAATKRWGLEDTHRAIIHGDAHVGNSYRTAEGSPGLLDWQCVWWGGGMFDTAYYIVSALSVEDRRASEVALLERYSSALVAAAGPDLPHSEILESYRRYLAYGMTVWLTNSTTLQPEEFNAVVAARFAQAMLDHGMIG